MRLALCALSAPWRTKQVFSWVSASVARGLCSSNATLLLRASAADTATPSERELWQPHLLPKVALIGRPNVGKSALFNRLVQRRIALVHDTPQSHVTRDWREEAGRLGDLPMCVVDTCGIEPRAPDTSIQGRGTLLTARMLRQAHLVLMVIDARCGVSGPDEDLAAWLHKHYPPEQVMLVANKAEGKQARRRMEETVENAYRLGFGELVAVSATTAEGLPDLHTALRPTLDRVRQQLLQEHGYDTSNMPGSAWGKPLPTRPGAAAAALSSDSDATDYNEAHDSELSQSEAEAELEQDTMSTSPVRLSIMGLPNVGKSTLLNRLLGEDRVVTGPEPGLTRDPVVARMQHDGRAIDLVDTAGYIGQNQAQAFDDVDGAVASKARGSGVAALNRTHVVALVLDAAAALKSQRVMNARELALVSQVITEGKALVIVANKMDALPGPREKDMYLRTLRERLAERLNDAGRITVVQMAAGQGRGVEALLPAVLAAHDCWNHRVSTGKAMRWFKGLAAAAIPGGVTQDIKRIRYITQASTRPPSFVCMVSGAHPVAESVQHFLAGRLRAAFGLHSTPVRFWFRYRQDARQSRAANGSLRLRGQGRPLQRAGAVRRPLTRLGPSQAEGITPRQLQPWQVMRQRADVAARQRGGLDMVDSQNPPTRQEDLARPRVPVSGVEPAVAVTASTGSSHRIGSSGGGGVTAVEPQKKASALQSYIERLARNPSAPFHIAPHKPKKKSRTATAGSAGGSVG